MRGRRPRPQGWKARNEIATRIASLIRILARNHYMPTMDDLARELEVHPRTVARDLAALEAAHWVLPLRPRETTRSLYDTYAVIGAGRTRTLAAQVR